MPEESTDEALMGQASLLRLRLPASSYQGLADRRRDLSRGAARFRRLETDTA